MNVLGLCDNHESGAALAADGRIVCAINEERLDRDKMSARFPWRSIDWVLSSQNLTPADIDEIVVAGTVTPVFFLRLFKDWHESIKRGANQFNYLLNLYIVHQVAGRVLKLPMAIEGILSRLLLTRRLRARGFTCPVRTIDHHLAHAIAAYVPSGLEPALVITADAMGDGLTVTVSLGAQGKLRCLYAQSGFSALNTYYSRMTQHLGFKANRHEGKIVGLAAHGNPGRLRPLMREQLHFVGPGFTRTNYLLPQSPSGGIYAELAGESREDVAAALQDNLDREVCAFVRHWIRATGVDNVALGGGLFANVKTNQRIHALDELRRIYIAPNMGDGGLCVGAALAGEPAPVREPLSPFLGPSFTEREIEDALAAAGLSYSKPADIADDVAARLADAQVVARFDGAMEYGPRALGNRSILYRTDDPTVMDWLNQRLDRTEFMPFAPMTLAEHRAACYRQTEGAETTWRFMNLCFDCTDLMRGRNPAVVHVDGTARPQILAEEDNPAVYALLSRYHARTGDPTVLNTSFNLHEEPIVCTPQDAVRAFTQARLDALAIGPFVVDGAENGIR